MYDLGKEPALSLAMGRWNNLALRTEAERENPLGLSASRQRLTGRGFIQQHLDHLRDDFARALLQLVFGEIGDGMWIRSCIRRIL